MSYEITFRFHWQTIDRRKVERAVQATLRDFHGAAIELEEHAKGPAAEEEVQRIAYTISLPVELVQGHRDDYDDLLPPADNGRFYGTFVLQADDEHGAYLMLEGKRNGHVWGLMSEIVTSIAEKLEGRLEQDEEEDDNAGDDAEDEAWNEGDVLEDDALLDWAALQDHVQRAYALDGDGEGWFATTVMWTDTPRTHQVRVTYFERDKGEPWVVLRSAVCKREQLAPEEALRRNDELPVATLALSGDVYELVYSFPMEALTASRFDMLLDQVAADADDLEELFSGGDEF